MASREDPVRKQFVMPREDCKRKRRTAGESNARDTVCDRQHTRNLRRVDVEWAQRLASAFRLVIVEVVRARGRIRKQARLGADTSNRIHAMKKMQHPHCSKHIEATRKQTHQSVIFETKLEWPFAQKTKSGIHSSRREYSRSRKMPNDTEV